MTAIHFGLVLIFGKIEPCHRLMFRPMRVSHPDCSQYNHSILVKRQTIKIKLHSQLIFHLGKQYI